MPFPGTRVIHGDFEEHHRPVAEGGQTATATVTRHSDADGVWNPATMNTDYPPPTPVYSGKARVQRQSTAEKPVWIGDRQVIVRTYVIGFPADAPQLRINDLVQVTAAGDNDLAAQTLYIHDVWHGSLLWERDVVCQNTPRTQR